VLQMGSNQFTVFRRFLWAQQLNESGLR